MAERGYKETWIFIRRDSEDRKYDKFFLPDFYELTPDRLRSPP
jgi:hypothetical protein